MSQTAVRTLRDYLKHDQLALIYRASFSDEFTELLIDLSEQNISGLEGLQNSSRKVSFLMAESFQNIVRHGEHGKAADEDVFIIRNKGNLFFIGSGNLVPNSIVDDLREKLDEVNELDQQQLREAYMGILKTGELSNKGGAGIGLIEMARKTGSQLQYQFIPFDDETTHFYMCFEFQAKGEETKGEPMDPQMVVDIHQLMKNNDVLLCYKGDYSHDSIVPVLGMLERNVAADEGGKGKRLFMVVAELLQNIAHHAVNTEQGQQGLLVIGQQEDDYSLTTGNYMETDSVGAFEGKMTDLNAKSHEEHTELYKKALQSSMEEHSNGVGVGLIDMARLTRHPFQYDFQEEGGNTFATLTVTV